MSEALEYIAETVADAANRASRNAIKTELIKLLGEGNITAELGFDIGTGAPRLGVYVPAVYETLYIENVEVDEIGNFPFQPHFTAQADECRKSIQHYRDFAAKLIAMADEHEAKLAAFVSA